jgi:hypothetical protein
MLDALWDRLFGRMLDAVARPVAARAAGTALAAFILGLAALPLIVLNFALAGWGLFALSRLLAAIAGRGGEGYLTAVCNAVNFAGLPLAFALADPAQALAAVFLMFGLAAQSAAVLKLVRCLIGNTELLVAFALACAFPEHFGVIAYITGVSCFIAAGIAAARRR